MSPELAALAATAFIQLAAVLWSQRALEADIGHDGNTGTREGLDDRLSEHTKRLRRALANHTENIGLFIIAVVLIIGYLARRFVPLLQGAHLRLDRVAGYGIGSVAAFWVIERIAAF